MLGSSRVTASRPERCGKRSGPRCVILPRLPYFRTGSWPRPLRRSARSDCGAREETRHVRIRLFRPVPTAGVTGPYSVKRQSATISNCDAEPIHAPGCIQAHGALLVLRFFDLVVLQGSENTGEILGCAAQDVRALCGFDRLRRQPRPQGAAAGHLPSTRASSFRKPPIPIRKSEESSTDL